MIFHASREKLNVLGLISIENIDYESVIYEFTFRNSKWLIFRKQ